MTKNGASWSLGNQVVLDTRSGHCLTTGPFFKEPSGRLWFAGNFIFGGLLSIYAKYSDDSGATWNYANQTNGQIACETKTTGAQGAWYQSLFVPYRGSVACIYMTYEDVYWTYLDGSGWSTCQQIPFHGDYSEAALGSATTDNDSNLYVSLFWNGLGKVIKWDGVNWANTGADFPSQAFIEACGNTIVAFYADSNEFYCRKYSTNTWADPVLVSTEARAITNRKIIVPQFAPDNCAYAVYTDGPGYDLNGGFVKLAKVNLTGGAAIIQKSADSFNVRAFPNPFNPNLTVSYSVATQNRPADVTVTILNAKGEGVATLVSGTMDAGKYKVVWNAEKQASGLYFCSINVNGQTLLKKVVLLK
ncbi:MAG: T9SS type A sorting domain-containing protein [Fibrobacterota bacterium]